MTRLGLLATVLLGGCSFVSMSGAATSDPPGVYPVCSDRVGPWVFDALAGTAVGLAAVSAASQGEPDVTAGIGAGAGVLVGSAIYGMVTRASCRARRAHYVAPQPAYRLDAAQPLRPPRRPVLPPAPTPVEPPGLVLPPVPAPGVPPALGVPRPPMPAAPIVPYSPPAQ